METKYKRVLLKLSGEFLGGLKGEGFDFNVIKSLTSQICQVHNLGFEIGIVLGGGNFFRGTKDIPLKMDRVAADHIGMMATLMNGICIKESLINEGKKAEVLTGLEAPGVAETFHKNRAMNLLQNGTILIFAGGTGNPFFSTDTAAVLRALEVEADIVIKGTKVDGVYDKDPVNDPSARKYERLTFAEILEKNLKIMDATAIALCRENELPLCVLSIVEDGNLIRFLKGEDVGTSILR
ncbi:UMP kinase [bacterium]|nr:UMP kinase [bacterium]